MISKKLFFGMEPGDGEQFCFSLLLLFSVFTVSSLVMSL